MAINVTLQVKRNGGAPQTGGVYAALNDVIQLTAASKNWPLNPPPRWEIYDYEDSFALPAGWTQDTDDATKPSYYFLGSADPPTFTVNPWGRYRTRLIVNGGVGGTVVDASTFIKVLSPSGLEKKARTEAGEFGGAKQQWTRADNANLGVLESIVSGSAPRAATPTVLTNANATLLYNTAANYTAAANLFTAARALTLGVSDSPPVGAVITVSVGVQTLAGATFTNAGGGGGSWSAAFGSGGTYRFRYDGTNWSQFTVPGAYGAATSNYAGTMSAVQVAQLAALYQTPTLSYSSGTPTLSAVSNAAETLFFLSGTVSVPKLSAASNWIGLRLVVKAENLSSPVVTADTVNPDLIDGAATYTIPGVYGSALFYSKATGVIRALPGNT